MNRSDLVLVNKVRAYERQLEAREKALAAAEGKKALEDAVFNKRYVLNFPYTVADVQPQTKSFTVDRGVKWWFCKRLTFSLSEVGTAEGGSAVNFTLNPVFRASQRSGLVLIRDSYRDRAWSNVPLPDGVFSNSLLMPRILARAAKLPGGTVVELTYTPVSALAANETALGFDASRYNFAFSFDGVEVRE